MHTNLVEWTEWALTPATVILLAAIHRLDLLAIVVPVAVLAAYAISSGCSKTADTQRKM
jgi:hypothetical protein